jgi:ferritin-like metal-binding protein YciE
MEKMNDLNDLLKHELLDLYSAEEQIIAALPAMIEKAKNPELKKSLQQHLKVTEQQKARLDQIQTILGREEQASGEKQGLLSRLFKSRQVCKGMQGIIEEGPKVMREDMHSDVMDAAIIACTQKVEHYEICGYGTARSFAQELELTQVATLLEQTLNEEYEADRLLTQLAESRVNKDAEKGAKGRSSAGNGTQSRSTGARSGATERSRVEEPEMEMASNTGRTAGAARKTAAAGRGGAAPKGAAADRSTITGNRTANTSKRNTSGGTGKSDTGSAAGGRGGSSTGRGGTSSRTGRGGR